MEAFYWFLRAKGVNIVRNTILECALVDSMFYFLTDVPHLWYVDSSYT